MARKDHRNGFYLRLFLVPVLALPTSSDGAQFAMKRDDVPGMSKFTESGSGLAFSFWYPTAWKVRVEPIADPSRGGWFPNATIIKELKIQNPAASAENDQPLGIILDEIDAPHGLIELGKSRSASPVGIDGRYFFDGARHAWMYAQLSDAPNGTYPATYPAKVMQRTMGGLPILAGAVRHGGEVIVPLNASHFLAISTMDVGGYDSHVYLASTVEPTRQGTDTASPQLRTEVIRREGLKLHALPDRLGNK